MPKEIHSNYKDNLNQGQIDNFLKLRRRKLAIYDDLYAKSEKQGLTPYMITLSPTNWRGNMNSYSEFNNSEIK